MRPCSDILFHGAPAQIGPVMAYCRMRSQSTSSQRHAGRCLIHRATPLVALWANRSCSCAACRQVQLDALFPQNCSFYTGSCPNTCVYVCVRS